MNKGMDWHGAVYSYPNPFKALADLHGADWVRMGDRLVYWANGEGAWPKVVYPEPPCGWDERDALV